MKSIRALFVVVLLVILGPPEAAGQTMKRITGRNTPAHQAALRYMRGVNLGNYLEYAPGNGARTQTYSASDFALIRAEGFDHVRIPVAWHLYAGAAPNYTLNNNAIFPSVDFMVNSALNQGLNVLIDFHHFNDFMTNPAGNRDKFYAIWRQVAAHYSNYPPAVAFELLNEPNAAATTTVMNQTYPEAIRQIRLSNPNRTLFLGPGQWNGLGELLINSSAGLQFPDNDTNLIATVHCYDPYYFTHQGAEWALPDTATTNVIYPGPPATPLQPHPSISNSWVLDWFRLYNSEPTSRNPSSPFAFRARIMNARSWADFYGRPVHIGEFGCYEKAPVQSRVNFHRDIRALMDQQGLGWALWDWKAGFHYFKFGQPDPPEMRAAIFPSFSLRIKSRTVIEWDAAVGKYYVIKQTASLTPPIVWQNVSTQRLLSPQFLSFDLLTNSAGPGFFEVMWMK